MLAEQTKMNREAVYEQLKIDEGVVYDIYLDHLGYPTFGVGHLIRESDEEFGRGVGTGVSEERVRACFERDLDYTAKGALDHIEMKSSRFWST
jgi:GH24 family phage-related lysozyme (muramidase)